MKKLYRKIMRKVCRFILGFERCPMDCRRSYGKLADSIVSAVSLCLLGMAMTIVFVLMA